MRKIRYTFTLTVVLSTLCLNAVAGQCIEKEENLTNLVEQIDSLTLTLNIERKKESPEVFTKLCFAMACWLEENREMLEAKTKNDDDALELLRDVVAELTAQVKQLGLANFKGALKIGAHNANEDVASLSFTAT